MPKSKTRLEAEGMGITSEMVREMNITGKLTRSDTWASAIAEYKRLNPTVNAPATSTEIALAPASAIVPATPMGAIVPHGGLTGKQINTARSQATSLLERYIERSLSPTEGIELYNKAVQILGNQKVYAGFMAKDRNNKILEIAEARHQNQAERYVFLHDKLLESSPLSIGNMVSSISGGVSSITGGVSNVAAAVGATMGATVGATSTAASAMIDLFSGPQTQTQPTGPLALLDSGNDSDDSQSSYTSATYGTTDDQLGQTTAAASLGGDTFTLSTTNQSTVPSDQMAALSLGSPTAPTLTPAPDDSAPALALAPAPDDSASDPALPPPPVASTPVPGADPAAPISGPATAPVSGVVPGAPISTPATAPAIISEATVKAMTHNTKAIIDATNALIAATRKAKSLSPDQLAVLSDQLEANPAVQNLVSSGMLKWDDLLRKDGDGKSVIDFAKIQKVSNAMRQRAQSMNVSTKQTYQRFTEERVRPGYKSNTKLKGLLSFTGPRFMPPPPFKK